MGLSASGGDLEQGRRALLAQAIRANFGHTAEVYSLQLAAGGNSRETWIADVRLDGGDHRVVFRCDPDHWIRPEEMRREIRGLALARNAGVPAPRLLLSSEQYDIGRPFTVTEFVPGCTIARRILRNPEFATARVNFARQCGEILARLHGAIAHAVDWPHDDPIADLERYRANAGYPSPVLVGALAWLARNRPATPAQLSPVHRDFRLGNLMFDESGIVAVLDWETCHLSDPHEDLAWLCSPAWRYGGEQPVGGIGALQDLFAAYESSGGCSVDQARLHWWRVYAATRWGLASNALTHSGSAGDVMEEGAIARQVCRQEYHVLLELKESTR